MYYLCSILHWIIDCLLSSDSLVFSLFFFSLNGSCTQQFSCHMQNACICSDWCFLMLQFFLSRIFVSYILTYLNTYIYMCIRIDVQTALFHFSHIWNSKDFLPMTLLYLHFTAHCYLLTHSKLSLVRNQFGWK